MVFFSEADTIKAMHILMILQSTSDGTANPFPSVWGVRLFPGGGVRLPVWLVMSGSPDVSLHLSPLICPQFAFLDVCVYLSLSICFPVCLVLLGSLDISLYLSPVICLPRGWWCLAFWMCLFPFCLVVSGSPDVFSLLALVSHHLSLAMCRPINLSPIIGLPQSWCPAPLPVRLCGSSIICLSPFVSYLICLRSHLSPIICLP